MYFYYLFTDLAVFKFYSQRIESERFCSCIISGFPRSEIHSTYIPKKCIFAKMLTNKLPEEVDTLLAKGQIPIIDLAHSGKCFMLLLMFANAEYDSSNSIATPLKIANFCQLEKKERSRKVKCVV